MVTYQITTPELVQFRYEIGGLYARALAWVLDELIILALRVLVVIPFIAIPTLGVVLVLILMFALDFGYFAVLETYWRGQTPGKKLLGLRVVAADGARLSFSDVLIRNLMRWVEWLPIPMVTAFVVAWFDRYHRRLGDLVAGTIVVTDVPRTVPKALTTHADRDNTFQTDPVLRNRILARITRDQRDLIYDLMLRRDQLEPDRRKAIFKQAADHLRQSYNLPDDLEHLSDEQTVLNIGLVLQSATIGR